MLFWIASILIIFLILFSGYLYAGFLNKIFREEKYGPAEGFVLILAIHQLIATPFLLFHWSFNSYFISFALIIIALTIYLLFKFGFKVYLRKGFKVTTGKTLLFLLILIQILFSFFNYRLDYDDSMYLSLANSSIKENKLYSYDPSTGNKDFLFTPFYSLESWELLIAFVSYFFQLPVLILAHTVLPVVLILFAYFSYSRLFSILVDKKYLYLMLIFLFIFHLMGAYSNLSQGNFLLARMWQGKAIFLHIMLPLLQFYCLKYLSNYRKKNIWLIFLILLASVGLNPSSIYLGSFVLLVFILTGLITDWKNYKKVIQLTISFSPILLYFLLIFFKSRKYLSEWHVETLLALDFSKDLIRFIGEGYYFYLFLVIIPLLFLLFKNKKVEKNLLLYTLLLFVLVINPLTAYSIAEHLTSSATYWRVFWLLPIGTILALFGVKTYRELISKNKLYGNIFLIFYTIILIFSGKFVYTEENKFRHEVSAYKISDEVVKAGNYLREKGNIKVLASTEMVIYLRSIADNVELIYTQYTYMTGFLDEESQELQERIYLFEVINGNIQDYERLPFLLDKYEVEVIVFNKSNQQLVNYLSKSEYQLEFKTGNYLVFGLN